MAAMVMTTFMVEEVTTPSMGTTVMTISTAKAAMTTTVMVASEGISVLVGTAVRFQDVMARRCLALSQIRCSFTERDG
jgi:hypothetical protein